MIVKNIINNEFENQNNKHKEAVKVEPNKTKNKSITNKESKLNTRNLESIPKIMASITRPTDNRGGSIYDLQLLHGIGAKISN